MRLISKASFKDYYDSCIGFGIDPKVVYVRTHEEVNVHREHQYVDVYTKARAAIIMPEGMNYAFGRYHGGDNRVDFAFVGFCGRVYPAIRVTEVEPMGFRHSAAAGGKIWFSEVKKHIFLYSAEEVAHYVEQHPHQTELASFLKYKNLEELFKVRDEVDAFLRLDAPIFAYCESVFHRNPRLSDFGFAKVMDGTQAFQEISAFVSGTLQAQNQMPYITVTDKEKAASKGFGEMSFRKRKAQPAG
ncbi:MAG: hypothetical protein RSG77_25585 [Hafnia sp.]